MPITRLKVRCKWKGLRWTAAPRLASVGGSSGLAAMARQTRCTRCDLRIADCRLLRVAAAAGAESGLLRRLREREEGDILAPGPPGRAGGAAVNSRRADGVDERPVRLRIAREDGLPVPVLVPDGRFVVVIVDWRRHGVRFLSRPHNSSLPLYCFLLIYGLLSHRLQPLPKAHEWMSCCGNRARFATPRFVERLLACRDQVNACGRPRMFARVPPHAGDPRWRCARYECRISVRIVRLLSDPSIRHGGAPLYPVLALQSARAPYSCAAWRRMAAARHIHEAGMRGG